MHYHLPVIRTNHSHRVDAYTLKLAGELVRDTLQRYTEDNNAQQET